MRRKYLTAVSGGIILLIFLFAGLGECNDFERISGLGLIDVNGISLDLNIYQDEKSVLMLFWTTWCPYCREALMELNDEYEKFEEEGVELIAVNVQESPALVSRFIKRYSLFLRVVLDRNARLSENYGVIGIPTYLLINKKGDIVFKGNSFPKNRYLDLISE